MELAIKADGITAVSFVVLTNVVANRVLTPDTDHTTWLYACGAPRKLDPIIVNMRSELPAGALVGKTLIVAVDPGLRRYIGSEEPQPNRPRDKIMKGKIDAIFLESHKNPFFAGRPEWEIYCSLSFPSLGRALKPWVPPFLSM